MSGKVINHAGIALPRDHYDVVIVGGGMLGLAAAFYIKQRHPDASLVVIEQGGIPSETGESFVSPAVLSRQFESQQRREQAQWTRDRLVNLADETGLVRPHEVPFFSVGELSFNKTGELSWSSFLQQRQAEEQHNLQTLVSVPDDTMLSWDDAAGYGSAEAVALYYGYAARRRGVDLMLNARVVLGARLGIERLAYNRQMQREVVAQETLSYEQLVVASGANTAAMLEDDLGIWLPYKRCYAQYPRIEVDDRLSLRNGKVQLPVISLRGITVRPQGEGLLIVPACQQADADAYQPREGRLMGINVGVRREILEMLLACEEVFPWIGWSSLNLGKTVQQVRGAWQVVTPSGYPEWQQPASKIYTLVGGHYGFSLGLAVAKDLSTAIT